MSGKHSVLELLTIYGCPGTEVDGSKVRISGL